MSSLTTAQRLDAAYYNALWPTLFARHQIPLLVPPDSDMFRSDLGRSLRVMFDWLGDLRGQRVLELGCGPGDYTIMLARRGAQVTAVDIAAASLNLTRRRAAAHQLESSVAVRLAAAETLAFPSSSFDLVVGFGLLHHADARALAPEIRRVLKPGGRALFREPLGENPLLHLIRERMPYRHKHRSPNEHPLTHSDIAGVGRYFCRTRQREFYLLSMISRAIGGEMSFPALWALDEFLLARVPLARRWCRYVLVEYAA